MHLNGEYQIGLTDICLCTRFLVNMGRFEIEFNNYLKVNEIITKVKSNQNVESDIKKYYNVDILTTLSTELKNLNFKQLDQLIADQIQLDWENLKFLPKTI